MTRRAAPTIAALCALLVLAGCNTPPPAEGPVDDNPVPAATPEAPAGDDALEAMDADSVLGMYAELTASNGATADLTLVVQRSTDATDPAASDRPAVMLDDCAGAYDAEMFADLGYSFSLVRVTFDVTSGDWPAGEGIHLVPATDHLSVASTGDVVDDPAANSEAPHCKRDKIMTGPGTGTMVVAYRGDAGAHTLWAGHNYGFALLAAGEFTACWSVATPLGTELGWPDPVDVVDETDICKTGDFTESDDS